MPLLEQICDARFGNGLSAHAEDLRQELYDYRRQWPHVRPTRQAIHYWFTKNSEPSDTVSLEFLSSYLNDHLGKIAADVPESRSKIEKVLADLSGRYLGMDASSPTPAGDSAITREPASQQKRRDKSDNYVLAMFTMLLEKARRVDHPEYDDFFYCSPHQSRESGEDESYYLAYRYSTTDREVLKTFVVIKKPHPEFSKQYSFLMFLRGGKSEADVARESMGVVLKYDTSYYLLGYNYRVAADRSSDPSTYRARRLQAKTNPLGLMTMAIEYADIGLDRGLFSCVTLASAAHNQPLIARVAMLHLGSRVSLGRRLSDDDIVPGQLSPDELASDLNRIVLLLQENKPKTLGAALSRLVTRDNWKDAGLEILKNDILRMIDNAPAAEKSISVEQTARGAIETFAKSSSSRPRP